MKRKHYSDTSGIILGMVSTNDSRRYYVKPSLIGLGHTRSDPCTWGLEHLKLLGIDCLFNHSFSQANNKAKRKLRISDFLWGKTTGSRAQRVANAESDIMSAMKDITANQQFNIMIYTCSNEDMNYVKPISQTTHTKIHVSTLIGKDMLNEDITHYLASSKFLQYLIYNKQRLDGGHQYGEVIARLL